MKKLSVAVAGVAVALCCAAPAHADAETDYLATLNDLGLVVYDARQALATGYKICGQLDCLNGVDVAEDLYLHTPWAAIPNRDVAAAWVIASAINLCPWNWHPERLNPALAPSPTFIA